MNIAKLSSDQLRRAAQIKERLEAAQAELAAILGESAPNTAPAPSVPAPQVKKLHWTQTPEGKARLARLVKQSWKGRRRA